MKKNNQNIKKNKSLIKIKGFTYENLYSSLDNLPIDLLRLIADLTVINIQSINLTTERSANAIRKKIKKNRKETLLKVIPSLKKSFDFDRKVTLTNLQQNIKIKSKKQNEKIKNNESLSKVSKKTDRVSFKNDFNNLMNLIKSVPTRTKKQIEEDITMLEKIENKRNKILLKEKLRKQQLITNFVKQDFSMNGYSRSFVYNTVEGETKNFYKFHKRRLHKLLFNLLKSQLLELGKIKFYVVETVIFRSYRNNVNFNYYANSKKITLLESSDKTIDDIVLKLINDLENRINNPDDKGETSKIYISIPKVEIQIAKYVPFKHGSYIPLPTYIQNKKACVNVKNNDNKCFKYAILSALHQKNKNAERVSNYIEHMDKYNWEGISEPYIFDSHKLSKFEKNNQISVNLYCFNTTKKTSEIKNFVNIDVLYVSNYCYEKNVDLLIYQDGEVKNDEKLERQTHVVWIKNLSRLISSEVSNSDHKSIICRRCLRPFRKQSTYDNHMTYCGKTEGGRIIMPTKGKDDFVSFNHFGFGIPLPFVIIYDFESLQVDYVDINKDTDTIKLKKHVPSGVCCLVIDTVNNKIIDEMLYRGENVVEHFINYLKTNEEKFKQLKNEHWLLNVTDEIRTKFDSSKNCYLCNCIFNDTENIKVMEHCHVTGNYRGAACKRCNTQGMCKDIPVIAHNSRGYDSHLILKEIGSQFTNIKCIPQSKEKYLTFSINNYKFIDSFMFISNSLETLVENVSNKGTNSSKFIFSKQYFKDNLDLMLRKGEYFYDYASSLKIFEETNIPTKEQFYNALYNKNISDEDYNHVQKVWKTFNIKNKGEYHDLYLRSDVYLLADVILHYRNLGLKDYGLDMFRYLTLPSFANDALYKITGIREELITDPDMYMFFERMIRGGISAIPGKYAKANNKNLPNYNSKEDSSFIRYLDANNLYGWAMSQYLPLSNFRWRHELVNKMTEENILAIPDDNDEGYVLNVDLEYPEELHDLHNDYPLAPVRRCVDYEKDISEYTKHQAKKLEKNKSNVEKLLLTLENKDNYHIHYRALKLYLSLGLKLKKVHSIISFKQSNWMFPYIDKNTELRKAAKFDCDKDFYKLMNNAVYGKSMENTRKRIDFSLVNNEKKYLKLVRDTRYDGEIQFNENLVGIQRHKTHTTLNKPIQRGASILDLSKLHMYNFHYNIMKKKYGENIRVLGTDTDSLIYYIKTDDIDKEIIEMEEHFDNSNYPKDHICFNSTNEKVIGKFKNESPAKEIVEFAGPNPKVYSMKIYNQLKEEYTEYKKGKGTPKYYIKSNINHDDYVKVVKGDMLMLQGEFNAIRSFKHQLYTTGQKKIALISFDDKQYMLDQCNSLSYGHKLIKKINS